MVAEILKVTELDLNGVAEIVTSLKVEEVIGNIKEKVEIPLTFKLPEKAEIKEVYLDLTVTGSTQKWRVYVGDFSLTKEFKPLLSGKVGDVEVSKFIFNVTPTKHVILEDPVLRIINTSKEPIKIIQTTLIVFYEYEGLGKSTYYYGVSLNPKKSLVGSMDPQKSGMIYAVIMNPEANEMRMKLGECTKKMNSSYVDELALECDKSGGYVIEGNKPFVPLTLLLGSYELNVPKIELTGKKDDGKVILKVKNKGSKADNVIVLLYSSGRILGRKELGPLDHGEEIEVPFEVVLDRKSMGVNARAIWVKANLRDFTEKFIPL